MVGLKCDFSTEPKFLVLHNLVPTLKYKRGVPTLNWLDFNRFDSIWSASGCFQFLRNQIDQRKKKPISFCFPTFSQYPNIKQTQKIYPKSCIYLENIPKYGKTYFPLLSYIFSTPKHQAPSKHKKHILRIKKIVFSFFFFFG